MKKISIERLAELLKAEYKLSLLECGGVDNWEGYSASLSGEYDDEAESYFDFEKKSDEKITSEFEDIEFLKNLQRLPYLKTEGYGEESLHTTDSCYEYIPTLAKFEGEWSVNWIHSSECDSIKVITGDTPIEAARNAYNWCVGKGFIKDTLNNEQKS